MRLGLILYVVLAVKLFWKFDMCCLQRNSEIAIAMVHFDSIFISLLVVNIKIPNLGGGGVSEERFTQDDVNQTLGRIEASMAAMGAVHFDADESEGDLQGFPMIAGDSREARRCAFCVASIV